MKWIKYLFQIDHIVSHFKASLLCMAKHAVVCQKGLSLGHLSFSCTLNDCVELVDDYYLIIADDVILINPFRLIVFETQIVYS